MILRICPYQILKNKHCGHFLKTILSIVNWLISCVKIHAQTNSHHSIFSAINTMMIYPSALFSWFYNYMYTRYRKRSTQIYTFICEDCVCWVTTFTFSSLRQSHSNLSKNKTPIH